MEQDVVVYRAIPGQTNDVTISSPSYGDHVVDDIVPITAGPGCAAVVGDATKVTCQLPTGNAYVNVDVGDGDDRVVMASSAHSEISGGAGNDVIIGGWAPGDDQHPGDVLRGGDDMDILNGGPGQDILDGGAGGDTLSGGSGQHDAVTYQGRTAAVRADIDGASHDDGEAGEGDTIGTGVEDLFGGDAADTLTGNAGPNTIKGGPGDDTISGGAGNDILDGREGIDTLAGQDGKDKLYGYSGGTPAQPETLDGGRGDDRLYSGTGTDRFIGGLENDTVDYGLHNTGVTADLDGEVGDDGVAGEHDTITNDVENLSGSLFTDTLIGNAAANYIYGVAGHDVILGLAGDDHLFGWDGDGILVGGDGNDTLRDSLGEDVLRGGAGADDLDGGWDSDTVDGGTGGIDQDTCAQDGSDTVHECETVT